jgi:hypothetical protein
MDHSQAVLVAVVAQGLGPNDTLVVQTTTVDNNGVPSEGGLGPWAADPASLPAGEFVRFRIEFASLDNNAELSHVDWVQIDYLIPVE